MTPVARPPRRLALALILAATPAVVAGATASDETADLFQRHCAACHGANRLGGSGPALLPQTLPRLDAERAAEVIANGRAATQMPAFGNTLGREQIEALARYVFTPPAEAPRWSVEQIEASRVVHAPEPPADARPVFDADPLNLFLVVESGDHHISVLDGDRLEPIHRFATRPSLHGGPKYSPDGRFVYLASRNGWVTKYDIYGLQTLVEVRAGINLRNIAVSADGRYVMAANYLPQTLVLLDARDLSVIKVYDVSDRNGTPSRVSAVYDAPPRQSFIAALKDVKEVWEIQYADKPTYYGPVHDWQIEGPPTLEPFPVRRIAVQDYLDDFFFDPGYENLIGAARTGRKGQVVNLLVGRAIAEVDLPGLPHLGSGITWERDGTTVLATPNLREGVVSVIDMKNWRTIARIETLGPGFFMRSHENSRYAWVDVFFGPNKDAVHVIDKQTLKIVKTLRPAPGKTSGHVEFTRDGRYALLSIWDMDGALVVYDADTLEEVKRLPMVKPAGKYNVWNKISRSAGTSH